MGKSKAVLQQRKAKKRQIDRDADELVTRNRKAFESLVPKLAAECPVCHGSDYHERQRTGIITGTKTYLVCKNKKCGHSWTPTNDSYRDTFFKQQAMLKIITDGKDGIPEAISMLRQFGNQNIEQDTVMRLLIEARKGNVSLKI